MLINRDFDFLKDVYDVLYMELRESDIKELKDSTGNSPKESLSFIINNTDILRVFEDPYGRIVGVYGIADIETDTQIAGNIFMLGTDDLEKYYPIEFLRISKREIESFMEDYDVLFNYVSSENKVSINWLKWLGFKVYEDKEVYFENHRVPFYLFKLERSEFNV